MFKKFIPVLLLLVLVACAKNKAELSITDKLAKADDLYARNKFTKAAELYDQVTFEKKSAATPRALMRLADCYFQVNKFTDARLKYIQLTGSYPDYADIETAYYRIALCYYEESLPPQLDQTDTVQSITAFRAFVDKYPNSKLYQTALDYIRKAQYKLLQKKYFNGFTYYRMYDYSAALMYFDEITGLGNTDELDRQAYYYTVKIHLKQKDPAAAKEAFLEMQSKYPNDRETKRLERYFR